MKEFTIIVITAEAAIENGVISATAIAGDKYVVDGDFGFIGSFKTLKEACACAKHDAEAANANFVVDV